jgi:UDP-N-acetylglucosamine acyltransferase
MTTESLIHETAIIDPTAKLGENVNIGAYSIIGEKVSIGDGSIIGPHVVLKGPTNIGKNNKIYQFASVGETPQDLSYKGEETRLEIGDNNCIREYATINRGTVKGGGLTKIGSNNMIMAYCHIAHDCQIASNVVLVNNTSLAGHVIIEDHVTLGGFTLVSQFLTIGRFVFSAMGSSINKDIPPGLLVSGQYASPISMNKIGLKRNDFSSEDIQIMGKAFKVLYKKGLRLEEALLKIEKISEGHGCLDEFIQFIKNSKNGIIR